MPEGSTGKVSIGRARIEELPSNRIGEEVSVVDRAKTTKELLVKEAIYICLNRHPSTGIVAWSCLDSAWLH